jgi:lipoprotein-anchoring transpeptidase ErfK/SrfK
LAYFSQVLAINPQNQRARTGISAARVRLAEKDNPSPVSPASERGSATLSAFASVSAFLKSLSLSFGWVGLGLLVLVLVVTGWATGLGQVAWEQWIATPTPIPTPTPTKEQLMAPLWSKLHGAWENQAWSHAIELLEQIRDIDPANADAEEKLFAAHFNFAKKLVKNGRLEEAITHFDQALSLRPDYFPAQRGRELAMAYLKGVETYGQGNWTETINLLEKIYRKDPNYQEVKNLLYEAHWRQGAILQEAGQLAEALAEYRRALEIQPYGTEASTRRAEVAALLKRIEIDVSEQKLTAWEGDKLIYSFVCSTGKPETPTKFGRFSVISKLPEAYSSVWDVKMPYWLGVYWAGGTENGIHGLPIHSSGQTLWGEHLGQRVSYGCIVLDTWAAKQLYEWAEIGTEVIIRE